MTKLTVTVITHDEEGHIDAALESISWADEIIVVDSHSSDRTVARARAWTPHVYVRSWPGYGAQKNFAAGLASHDWILSIDADERVTPELGAEIRTRLERGPDAGGYLIPRVSYYLGRWIRSTDWYPDFHLRLYDRRAGRWSERTVHESVTLSGRAGRLRHELQHYPYKDVSEHLSKIDRYTTLIAEQWMTEGRRATAFQAAIYSRLAFLRNFILRQGFRDGRAGFLVSRLNAYYVFLKYVKLMELEALAASEGSPASASDRQAR